MGHRGLERFHLTNCVGVYAIAKLSWQVHEAEDIAVSAYRPLHFPSITTTDNTLVTMKLRVGMPVNIPPSPCNLRPTTDDDHTTHGIVHGPAIAEASSVEVST